jgi:hypothetical protein
MNEYHPKPTPAPSCAMSLTAACFRWLQRDGRVADRGHPNGWEG